MSMSDAVRHQRRILLWYPILIVLRADILSGLPAMKEHGYGHPPTLSSINRTLQRYQPRQFIPEAVGWMFNHGVMYF